jgi:micrococcal nuclease
MYLSIQKVFLSFAIGGFLSQGIGVAPGFSQTLSGSVISVGDGDTLRVNTGQETLTVRLACIDTPEMAQTPFGLAASQRLKELLPVGQEVMLQIAEKDRYGRTVASVFANGTAVSYTLVAEGQAVVYRQYLSSCPDLSGSLLAAEAAARENHLGFWSQPDPVMPWDFRRGLSGGTRPVQNPERPLNGPCNVPSDRTSNGSRCGGRAASQRPGGRSRSRVDWRRAQEDIDAGRYTIEVTESSGRGSSGGYSGGGGGPCNVPSDQASNGSSCGGRAASQRPGGR